MPRAFPILALMLLQLGLYISTAHAVNWNSTLTVNNTTTITGAAAGTSFTITKDAGADTSITNPWSSGTFTGWNVPSTANAALDLTTGASYTSGTYTVTFSSPVDNPYMAVASLGNAGNNATIQLNKINGSSSGATMDIEFLTNGGGGASGNHTTDNGTAADATETTVSNVTYYTADEGFFIGKVNATNVVSFQFTFTRTTPATELTTVVFGFSAVASAASGPAVDPTVAAVLSAPEVAGVNFTTTVRNSMTRRMSFLHDHKDTNKKSKLSLRLKTADPVLKGLYEGLSSDAKDEELSEQTKNKYTQAMFQIASNKGVISEHTQADAIALATSKLKEQMGGFNLNPTGGTLMGDWSGWMETQLTMGKIGATNRSTFSDIDTYSVTMGVDHPREDKNGFYGFSATFGQSDTDIGTDGSGVKSNNYSIAAYGSMPLGPIPTVEGMIGIGRSMLDTKRVDGEQTLTGNRNMDMAYGFLMVRDEPIDVSGIQVKPFGRAELSYFRLSDFSEDGGVLALHVNKQDMLKTMAFIGSDLYYQMDLGGVQLNPFGSLEYGYDFSRSSSIDVQYISASSTNYHIMPKVESRSHWKFNVGAEYETDLGLAARVYYEQEGALNHSRFHTIKLSLDMTF
ncbi:autotransporter domain-containing protein [Terasakiella sp. SH-1]|uniref:autotransporter family protein n=1 Tax=Terasakiella sp. SH-1 TaxID=2560057 RepID=UPI00142FB697|nr:autotransporter domain-containing protein [Terasakiella sp. SH-1]